MFDLTIEQQYQRLSINSIEEEKTFTISIKTILLVLIFRNFSIEEEFFGDVSARIRIYIIFVLFFLL